jgi:hypothetical protein
MRTRNSTTWNESTTSKVHKYNYKIKPDQQNPAKKATVDNLLRKIPALEMCSFTEEKTCGCVD